MNNSEIIETNYAKATQGIKSQWLDAVSFEWYNYVVGLPLELKVTYLVVVFHNQIMNGGFHQYFVNGYGQFAEETISALSEIGVKTKRQLLSNALQIVNSDGLPKEDFIINLLNKKISSLFLNDDLAEPLGELDMAYYAEENEDIVQLLSSFLRK
ncbi:DUF4375 domain-containing protein [Niabella sp. CJ426]|uniref:DMP19 family protein n=1 Tax=Niabella sp. CJ426 TaxID=3393740 RepID=UPI003CFF2E4F